MAWNLVLGRSGPRAAQDYQDTMTDFSMFGLDPKLMEALTRQGISEPTPIQARAIPPALQGRDILGMAQTGTGKTLAFGLPLLQDLGSVKTRPMPGTARALIMAPTRELVNQIAEVLTELARGGPLRIVTVVGGASLNKQSEKLARGTDLLVATPGRLIDLMDRGAVKLSSVRALVLDEADQMLDLGFIHALRRIARDLPKERQTMLFSATMPKQLGEIAQAYLQNPLHVQVNPSGKAAERIDQMVHYVAQGDKAKLLQTCLAEHPDESALVFSRTKHGAEKLMKLLKEWGFVAGSIHGNKSQGQRERTLADFRSGALRVLVATDVAARGIDIPLVRHVYNFELPNVPENYVHRIGRTARAGAAGRAVAFCAPAEMADLRAIEALTRQRLSVLGGTPWPEDMAEAARQKARAQPRGGAQGGPRRSGAKPAAGARPGGAAVSKPGGKPAAKPGAKPAGRPFGKPVRHRPRKGPRAE